MPSSPGPTRERWKGPEWPDWVRYAHEEEPQLVARLAELLLRLYDWLPLVVLPSSVVAILLARRLPATPRALAGPLRAVWPPPTPE